MSNTINWGSHTFTIYPAAGTTWHDVGGVYIFTGQNSQGQWVALYIGKADSFQSRLGSHERWNEAPRAGGTHVHAMVVPLEANRALIEAALIQSYQPKLNTLPK